MPTRNQISSALPMDGNDHPIQCPSRLRYDNGTRVSPVANVGTTPMSFTVPANAIVFEFKASAAIRYGDNEYLDGVDQGRGYRTGAASSEYAVPCLDGQPIYISAEVGTVTVEFSFEMSCPKPA